MAKRFIDTDIFKKKSIRGLDAPYKLLYVYLLTDCNHAGIWEVDLEVAGIKLGCTFSEAETIKKMGGAITVFDGGAKWYVNSFVEFQYGELNPNNRAHKSVLDHLSKYFTIEENKPLIRPLQGCKDMDKDMVKELDKDMDKDNEPEFELLPYPTFEDFWDAYNKKRGDVSKIKIKWGKLSQSDKEAIMDYIPKYIFSQPDKQYRKDPLTFLNNKSWNDEIIEQPAKTITQGNNGMANRNQINFTPEHLRMGEHSKYRKNPAE